MVAGDARLKQAEPRYRSAVPIKEEPTELRYRSAAPIKEEPTELK